jgi:hypothetical protein
MPKKLKIGVYSLEPFDNENYARFKEKGYVRYGKNFDDEVIKLDFIDESKIKYKVDLNTNRVIYNENIYIQFYKDNVASTYFCNTTKIPIFHCAVMYNKSVIIANLLNIYLYFNIKSAKSIRSYKELISKKLPGSYELIIEFNDKQDNLPFDNFTNFNDMIYTLIELFSTDIMGNMINEEIEKRSKERVDKYGDLEKFTLPSKTVNFNDLVKQYKENNGDMDKIMNNFS